MLDDLGGPERAFGDFGADVDFSWRAQQAGRRVVVVPRATLRTGAEAEPDDVLVGDSAARMRRQARRVALARCAWWTLPLLAAWIVLSSTVPARRCCWPNDPARPGLSSRHRRGADARAGARGTVAFARHPPGPASRPAGPVRPAADRVAPHDRPDPRRGRPRARRGRGRPRRPRRVRPGRRQAQDLNVLGATWARTPRATPGCSSPSP